MVAILVALLEICRSSRSFIEYPPLAPQFFYPCPYP
jgi:hypothetical protein